MTDHSVYLDFLRRKIKLASFAGFDISDDEINPILKGRKGRASELNTGYFFDGVQYLRAAEREVSMPSLFDGIEIEEAV